MLKRTIGYCLHPDPGLYGLDLAVWALNPVPDGAKDTFPDLGAEQPMKQT
jgi:hypothetical protein